MNRFGRRLRVLGVLFGAYCVPQMAEMMENVSRYACAEASAQEQIPQMTQRDRAGESCVNAEEE